MIVNRLAGSLNTVNFRSVVCLFRSGWLYDTCRTAGLPTYVLPINGAFDLKWARNFIQLVKKERIGVIHAHEFTANVYGTMLGRLANVPVVATVHGKNYYWEQTKRRAAYRFVSRTGRMIAVSHDLKRFIGEKVGIPERRIHVIYNGVEPHLPPDRNRVQKVGGELGLSRWEHIIGTVGSLYPVKGHVHLIRSLPSILRECPKTVLLIVGQGELETNLKAEVGRLGLDEHVQFLGFRSDVSTLLSLMQVFVLPSLSEGLSMALLEAMAAGLPTVATNVGGNGELVHDNHSGYLVPSEDPESLADRVIRLLKNKEQARAFGSQGKQRVAEKFSMASMVSNYQECYVNAIGQRRQDVPAPVVQ